MWTVKLFLEACRLNIRRSFSDRKSLALEALGNIMHLGLVLVFWEVIYGKFPGLIGLERGYVYLFLFYAELFFALKSSFALLHVRFWQIIYSGRIEVYLLRPVDPLVNFTLNNFHIESLIISLPAMIGFLVASGTTDSPLAFITGIIICLAAVGLTALLELSFALTAFWVGRIPAIEELADSFSQLNRFPFDIFPSSIRFAFTFILPFAFNATIPAVLASTGRMPLVWGFALLMLYLAWWSLVRLLWHKGMTHYTGIGGKMCDLLVELEAVVSWKVKIARSSRANAFLKLIGFPLRVLTMAFFWTLLARSADDYLYLIFYYAGAFLISLMYPYARSITIRIAGEIQEGDIAFHLLRGLPYWLAIVADWYASVRWYFVLVIVPYTLVALAVGVTDPSGAAWFLAFLLFGSIAQLFLWASLGSLGFWFQRIAGPVRLFLSIQELLNGTLLPLSFIPGILGSILRVLPFRFFVYQPLSCLLSGGETKEQLTMLAILLGWCVGFFSVFRFLFLRGLATQPLQRL